jgi:hypothetical protein
VDCLLSSQNARPNGFFRFPVQVWTSNASIETFTRRAAKLHDKGQIKRASKVGPAACAAAVDAPLKIAAIV